MSDDETPTPTPRYRQVLDASAELARELGHSYIGVEHLFLAIVQDRAAVPTQVLARITDLDRAISGPGGGGASSVPPTNRCSSASSSWRTSETVLGPGGGNA
jgi:hypothetical protein